ncbi:MAG: DUF433 domain-containing protein [Proteobacteria bacterium]|nr:DUF433 domain-containing protein [Pseudomonadota bacterium]
MVDNSSSIGIYSAPEAAQMIGMGAQTLRRWLIGYEFEIEGVKHSQPPLWSPQHAVSDGELLLGFRDLVEARVVSALRRKGIALQTIRVCLDRARNIVGDQRPLSTRSFKTDGRSIFLEITEGVDEPQLIDLKKRQGVFHRVVEPSLSGLEFGADAAERWWLLSGKRTIVADPAFAFGAPSVAGHGMTTSRIAQAVRAEGSPTKVARLYEINPNAVRDAIKFESNRGLRRAA